MADVSGYIILGIDPGSIRTGYGIIRKKGTTVIHIENGIITPPKDAVFKDRVAYIFKGLCDLIDSYHPQYLSLEDIFMGKNASSALKLGHVRGVVMAAAVLHNIPLAEYSSTRVKQAVAGNGRAQKFQIQEMVRAILGLRDIAQEDASDALAIAITHAFAG